MSSACGTPVSGHVRVYVPDSHYAMRGSSGDGRPAIQAIPNWQRPTLARYRCQLGWKQLPYANAVPTVLVVTDDVARSRLFQEEKMLERAELALLACVLAFVFALQFYLLSSL
jgi:hypothetical protein